MKKESIKKFLGRTEDSAKNILFLLFSIFGILLPLYLLPTLLDGVIEINILNYDGLIVQLLYWIGVIGILGYLFKDTTTYLVCGVLLMLFDFLYFMSRVNGNGGVWGMTFIAIIWIVIGYIIYGIFIYKTEKKSRKFRLGVAITAITLINIAQPFLYTDLISEYFSNLFGNSNYYRNIENKEENHPENITLSIEDGKIKESLGVQTCSGEERYNCKTFSKIINGGEELPTSGTKEFITYSDFQRGMKFDIYQGEDDDIKNDNYLGTIEIKGITPTFKGQSGVIIHFNVDKNGVLTIYAIDINNSENTEIIVINSIDD